MNEYKLVFKVKIVWVYLAVFNLIYVTNEYPFAFLVTFVLCLGEYFVEKTQ